MEVLAAVSLFGGCCLNVVSLELLLKDEKLQLGSVLTFTQFVSVTLIELPNFVRLEKGSLVLKARKIPILAHLVSMLLFLTGSVLNNAAFMFNVSVPVHIVIKCLSTVSTMVLSQVLLMKRYTLSQKVASILMTVGAIITSLYKQTEFSSFQDLPLMLQTSNKDPTAIIGIVMLLISTLAMSLLSVFNEYIFNKYGKFWQESSFYTHILALPLFPLITDFHLITEVSNLLTTSFAGDQLLREDGGTLYYTKLKLLLLNNITQYICIQSVNWLSSLTDALTLSVVLLVRKFISLLISVYFFGNHMTKTSRLGAGIVFCGALLYSFSSAKICMPSVKTKSD